jgi:SAM-dependent methyltransferase
MMLGAWDIHHGELNTPKLYGDETTYRMIADLARGRGTVEDWGCGGGGLSAFIEPGQHYVGVDGSASPFATVTADLRTYRSAADVVVLRHVLEHNYDWQLVLDNAFASAQRLIVVLFTPLVPETHVMFTEPDHHAVPVIAFRLEDILGHFRESDDDVITLCDTVESPGTAFNVETVIVADR